MAKEITNEELASMIKEGFDGVDKKFKKVENDIKELKQGQENIELRLTNVAYRFELQELQQRVEMLEKKVGMKMKK